MEQTQSVIETALAAVASSRALRERAIARRAEMLKRTEAASVRPLYVRKKRGGQQLRLNLDA